MSQGELFSEGVPMGRWPTKMNENHPAASRPRTKRAGLRARFSRESPWASGARMPMKVRSRQRATGHCGTGPSLAIGPSAKAATGLQVCRHAPWTAPAQNSEPSLSTGWLAK